MKNYKILISLILIFLTSFSILLTTSIIDKKMTPYNLPSSILEGTNDPINIYKLEDFSTINKITHINHSSEFIRPNAITKEKVTKPISLENFSSLSKKGTLQIIFCTLDPLDENYQEKYNKLEENFSVSNTEWLFSIYIPPILSASEIYIKTTHQASNGQIAEYDYIKYSNINEKTENHTDGTNPNILDFKVYKRKGYSSDVTITIHYECVKGQPQMLGDVLIGQKETLEIYFKSDKSISYAIILSSFIIFILISFVCYIKKNLSLVNYLILLCSIMICFIGKYSLLQQCSYPYLALTLQNLLIPIQLISTFNLFPKKYKKLPIRLIFIVVSVANLLLILTNLFFVNILIYNFNLILNYVLCAFVVNGLIINFATNKNIKLYLGDIIVVLTCVFSFLKTNLLVTNPLTYFSILLILLILFVAIDLFNSLEKRNNYLTQNLQIEVKNQTNNLKTLLDERDNVLRFLSHDIKKTIQSIKRFASNVKLNEDDDENTKAINIIELKAIEIEKNLEDISKLSKSNFIVENSQNISLEEIFNNIYSSLCPDCEANGIILEMHSLETLVFAKKNNLISVISNLIINSVEHANCNKIIVKALLDKNVCKILVSDNGKKIKNNEDIFLPYISENENNSGLGLYICKTYIEQMNGTLNFDSQSKTFIISLPIG